MRKTIYNIYIILLLLTFVFHVGCSDSDNNFDDDNAYPPPSLELTSAKSLVAIFDGETTVTGKVESEAGIRDVYCTLLEKTEKGYKEINKNERVYFSVENMPKSLDFSVTIPIKSRKATAVRVTVLNSITKTTEQIIAIEGMEDKPSISFQDDRNTRNTVCVGIPFRISGKVQNECEITSVSFIPVVNGERKTPVTAPVNNKNKVEYSIMVPVESGLQHVIARAENIYGGVSEKQYAIVNVVTSDFAILELPNEEDVLKNMIIGEKNILPINITSGSDLVSIKLATKVNGVFGTPTTIQLPERTENELDIDLDINTQLGMEAIQIEVKNLSGITEQKEYPIVLTHHVAILKDLEMSTDPADNKCFLALYESVQVFGASEAMTKQSRIDWVLTQNGAQAQPVSPHAYGADKNYYNRTSPYIMGFTNLTYMFLSALRGNIVKEDIDKIKTDYEIGMYIRDVIVPGYNVPKASRRVGDNYSSTGKKSGGFIIGWGSHTHPATSPSVANNTAFGLVWVKSVTLKPNGHSVLVFDIIYPSTDQRVANNTASITPYDPYPL